MVTICSFISSECKNHLIITHWCSNNQISRIKSITLVDALDLTHCDVRAVLPSIRKQRYPFPSEESFWPGLWVVLLYLYFSESDTNITRILSEVALWLFSLGASNDWYSLSTGTFESIIFFVCGLDRGLFWTRSSAEPCTAYFKQECVPAYSYSSLAISTFSLNLLWLFEVDEVSFDGLLATPGWLCSRPIMFAMVDE